MLPNYYANAFSYVFYCGFTMAHFTPVIQGYFTGAKTNIRLAQCEWRSPERNKTAYMFPGYKVVQSLSATSRYGSLWLHGAYLNSALHYNCHTNL